MRTWEEVTEIFSVKTFELKEEHVKLLQRDYVDWNDCEYGAPEINPKRPFGNSGRHTILLEMAEILGLETFKDMDGDDSITEAQSIYLEGLWWETDVALQIILRTRSFQPGVYEWPEHHMRMIRPSTPNYEEKGMTEPKVPLKRTEIATLCKHCSKEFEMFKDDTGDPTLVWNWCPHCGEKNSFWHKFLGQWDLRPENRPPMGLTAMQAHEKFQSSASSVRNKK